MPRRSSSLSVLIIIIICSGHTGGTGASSLFFFFFFGWATVSYSCSIDSVASSWRSHTRPTHALEKDGVPNCRFHPTGRHERYQSKTKLMMLCVLFCDIYCHRPKSHQRRLPIIWRLGMSQSSSLKLQSTTETFPEYCARTQPMLYTISSA
jgi:hypothetical protein